MGHLPLVLDPQLEEVVPTVTPREKHTAGPDPGGSPPEEYPLWEAEAPRRKDGEPSEEASQPKEEDKGDLEAIAKQEWLARTWDGWGSEEDAGAGAEPHEDSTGRLEGRVFTWD
ncbi:UNVERIFIED_CONTAM: hypothetical protein K2H54_004647 [Gekko kuhli]